ncbi:hypothetical protein NAP1_13248 [Erythrobacter sp. NAP1]|uniref:hypothetical protein n=1 Tax=Erythrobacter sp. NAP1 TaxID=237727 RepID=UPI0000687752|nr:hypothetical protein [Erythrobacter sp. NAP1]EAQ28567.1 hypothetical protein NAP1_13248 [Erythrobacter sp. NAP1]
MTSLSLIIAPLVALQGVGQAPVAIENDAPETWTLEYPRLIQPFVADYRRCLSVQLRKVRGQADFESQHRSDLPRCAEVLDASVEGASSVLSRRGENAEYTAADVREIFEHIGRIHIARGADLDNQFTFVQRSQAAAQEQYEAERPKGLVLELRDASVVKARTDETADAAQAAYEEREARSADNQ